MRNCGILASHTRYFLWKMRNCGPHMSLCILSSLLFLLFRGRRGKGRETSGVQTFQQGRGQWRTWGVKLTVHFSDKRMRKKEGKNKNKNKTLLRQHFWCENLLGALKLGLSMSDTHTHLHHAMASWLWWFFAFISCNIVMKWALSSSASFLMLISDFTKMTNIHRPPAAHLSFQLDNTQVHDLSARRKLLEPSSGFDSTMVENWRTNKVF